MEYSCILGSLRSADAFPVVASLGGREATTGNASALRRLHIGLGEGGNILILERWGTERYIIGDQGKNFCCEDGVFVYSHNFHFFVPYFFLSKGS